MDYNQGKKKRRQSKFYGGVKGAGKYDSLDRDTSESDDDDDDEEPSFMPK